MEVVVTLVVIVAAILEVAVKVLLTFALVLLGFATALGLLVYLAWPSDEDPEDPE